jgi:hypothetical protein
MTQRERVMLTSMLAALVVVGGGFAFNIFVWQPLSNIRERVETARLELAEKQTELSKEKAVIAGILKVNPRLAAWNEISLSPMNPVLAKTKGLTPEERKSRHLSHLQVDYERYLDGLMRGSGFAADSIVITAKAPERKGNPILSGKVPVFERLGFTVSGRAKLEGVVRLLQTFHAADLLHQIRNISLALIPAPAGAGRSSSSGNLQVSMTIEALMVRGAQERTTLSPALGKTRPKSLAQPNRQYADMTAKNMFVGIASVSVAPRYNESRKDVLRFVRLTTLCHAGRRWEAYIYDLGKGGDERRVNARTLTNILIRDKYDNTILDAEVVHIDSRQLIYREDGRYYRLRCGDFFYPASELTAKEITDLGLSDSE